MKIAIMYMDVTNLGDLVIYENARYLVESILHDSGIEDCEIVPVDIGELHFKEDAIDLKRAALQKAGRGVKHYAKNKRFYEYAPGTSKNALRWAWRRTQLYQHFKKYEEPKLEGVDLIIFGGGGLAKFHRQNFHYMLDYITDYANQRGIPVIFNAIGVEGYSGKNPECMILKEALNRKCVRFVSARDDYRTLVENFITAKHVKTKAVCDPAFWTAETYGVEKAPRPVKTIGLNAIRFNIFKSYMYEVDEERLKGLYVYLIKQLSEQGYHVDFFSNGVASDTEFIQAILDENPELVEEYHVTLSEPQTARELVETIAGYDRFMAARLHASIVGSVLGIPNISLIWNIKQPLFGQRIGMPQNYLERDEFYDYDLVLERLLAAEPYTMDMDYKNSVRDSLEEQILIYLGLKLRSYSKPEWGAKKLAKNTKSALKTAKRDARKIVRKTKRKVDREQERRKKAEIREITEVIPNKIAIFTNTSNYTCNPKYIYKELVRQDCGYDIVWLVKGEHGTDGYPDDARVVAYDSEEGCREAYSAKLWLDNGIAFSNHFDMKPDQMHIQTMHGSLGIKIIDNAVLSRNARGKSGQLVVKRETENTNYVITNSLFEEEVFRRVFWKDTPMVRLGHARTDILFSEDEEVIRNIRATLNERYGIPVDAKTVTYAPTHRKDMTIDDLFTDYPALIRALEERFGGTFVVMLRLHDRTKNIIPEDVICEGVYNVTDYPDMQELMLITDVGITDYSSWIFDYVLMRRPGFHYATDADRYEVRTGLAYPLEESPFPAASSPQELLDKIAEFDQDSFVADVEAFLEDKQSVDDGHSAERIVNWLKTILPPDGSKAE